MNGFGAKAYARVEVESGVAEADPHRLILMLYDGVLSSIRLAEGHMRASRIPEKCAMLSKAVRIVDEGLKASLDMRAGGNLAQQLGALYDYIVMRLLQANLRNQVEPLQEVAKLLENLRNAWLQIADAPTVSRQAAAGPQTAAAPVTTAPASATAAAPAAQAGPATTPVARPAALRGPSFDPAPAARRLAISA
ncbi:MAG TPA: flagellar export chaperone FliS [Burkholderiaceae bacterium]|nr:flagellar export chaperone FliS [Burkholderiaceae bacterium]